MAEQNSDILSDTLITSDKPGTFPVALYDNQKKKKKKGLFDDFKFEIGENLSIIKRAFVVTENDKTMIQEVVSHLFETTF